VADQQAAGRTRFLLLYALAWAGGSIGYVPFLTILLPVRVAALVVDYTSGGASLVMRRDTAKRLFGLESADVLLVTAAEGQAAALRAALEKIADRRGMLLRSAVDVRKFIDGIVGGVVGSLWAILGLGFAVAGTFHLQPLTLVHGH